MGSNMREAVERIVAGISGTAEEIVALIELIDRAEAALVERVTVFDAAQGWEADGAYSFACWLRARADISRDNASRLHRFARTLRTMPATEATMNRGKLSVAKARVLAEVINPRTQARFDEQEEFLIDQFQALDVDAAKVAARYWKRLADSDGPDPADPARNRASMTKGWDDRWHLEADLDPVSGAIVRAAIQAITDRMHQEGSSADRNLSCGQQQAEALVEMANRSTGAGPNQAAVHPEIVVIVPVERLAEAEPDPFTSPPELIGTGPICIEDVLRRGVLGFVSTIRRRSRPAAEPRPPAQAGQRSPVDRAARPRPGLRRTGL